MAVFWCVFSSWHIQQCQFTYWLASFRQWRPILRVVCCQRNNGCFHSRSMQPPNGLNPLKSSVSTVFNLLPLCICVALNCVTVEQCNLVFEHLNFVSGPRGSNYSWPLHLHISECMKTNATLQLYKQGVRLVRLQQGLKVHVFYCISILLFIGVKILNYICHPTKWKDGGVEDWMALNQESDIYMTSVTELLQCSLCSTRWGWRSTFT